MPCDCIFANVFTVFVTVTFLLHLWSLASPCWVCNGAGCAPRGIYDACAGGNTTKVESMGPFVLAIFVLISNAALMVIFCIKVRVSFLPALGIFTFILIIWFFIQEAVLGSIIFGILFKQYDTVGWAAYLFFIPGLVMVLILVCILGFYICVTKGACAAAGGGNKCCGKCCCCFFCCFRCCEPGEKA